MASSTKTKTTMAKRNRENAVRERRARKAIKKEARKRAAAEAQNEPEVQSDPTDAPVGDAGLVD